MSKVLNILKELVEVAEYCPDDLGIYEYATIKGNIIQRAKQIIAEEETA